jgi:hypothetical protein
LTAPGSVREPSLFAPAAVGAPELLASPEAGIDPEPIAVPVVPLFTAAPLLIPPVVPPFVELPVVVWLPADPPACELPPAEPPELCANADVPARATAVANAIVVSFMVASFC